MFSLEMFSKEQNNNEENTGDIKKQVFAGLKAFISHHKEIKRTGILNNTVSTKSTQASQPGNKSKSLAEALNRSRQ